MSKINQTTHLSGRQKRNKAAWISGLAIILIYSVVVNPAHTNITTCRFNTLTGLDCPTCGISRSFYAFSHFNFSDAFHYHIFGPLLFSLFIFFLLLFSTELILNRDLKIFSSIIHLKWIIGASFGIWMAVWLFKILV